MQRGRCRPAARSVHTNGAGGSRLAATRAGCAAQCAQVRWQASDHLHKLLRVRSQGIQLLLAGKLVGLQCAAVAAQQQQVSKRSRKKCGCCTCSAPQRGCRSEHSTGQPATAPIHPIRPSFQRCRAVRSGLKQASPPAPPGTAFAGAAATAASTPAGFPHARCSGGGRHGWWLVGQECRPMWCNHPSSGP